jgi:exonuclease SbcC
MHGFAAFREPTEVDFTDAEYFVLVGPTGSGKSTVIDAMTFALYGSVPRWGNKGVVALALSPTANRGGVALEFDVGGQRYTVARDLRRTANGSVTVREARLERLLTPDTEDAEELPETEVLAHGGAVSKAVEDLLGLPFEQFCMCVVLPQGEFAQFLRAAPAERQKVLTRILGLGMYEQMAKEAGAEAKEQHQRAEWLTGQLADYADATEEAAATVEARKRQLAALVERVGAALPALAERDAQLLEADRAAGRLHDERTALAGLHPPGGLDELGPRAKLVEHTLDTARRRMAAAEAADTEARARLAEAPPAEPLRRLREEHAELTWLREQLPSLEQTAKSVGEHTEQASRAAAAAEADRDRARTERDEAAARQAGLLADGERLAAERKLLDAPRMPDDVAELDERRASTATALAKARRELADAEAADRAARQALRDGPDRSQLAQARREHLELADTRRQRDEAEQRAARAQTRLDTATAAVAAAERALTATAEARAVAQRVDLAGALRPALVLHQPCPVCDQPVQRLPRQAPATDLAAAEHAVHLASQYRERAATEHREADEARRRASSELDGIITRIAGFEARLTGAHASIEQVDTQLALVDELATAARTAESTAADARRRRDTEEQADGEQAQRLATSVSALRSARDPLVALGAPSVETGPGGRLADGWRALTEWAREAVTDRDQRLNLLRAEHAEAKAAHTGAQAGHAEAEERLRMLREAQNQAIRDEQDASRALALASDRIAELTEVLRDAPGDVELARRLAELQRLSTEARDADDEARAARRVLAEADGEAAQLAQDVEHGWRELHTARDPLVALGAPALHGAASSGSDLVAAWTTLNDWAAAAAAGRVDQLATAQRELAEATDRRDRVRRELVADLAGHQVTVPEGRPLAHTAAAAASSALQRAISAGEWIAERQAKAAKLVAERTEAGHGEGVARMLADLLRSNNFQRWLVTSALDALVTDASRSLAELSGGQFELTHADGEFLVVDHADADARRPVKTLSGGETFQASLALALALSEQLSTLASAGAARLDSIFLDEGFGTLDEANLQVVADTLENLASLGDRMVGVITHVPGLAERVPVRFSVTRDQRTASISRGEGLG